MEEILEKLVTELDGLIERNDPGSVL